jgi:hypothetical protein
MIEKPGESPASPKQAAPEAAHEAAAAAYAKPGQNNADKQVDNQSSPALSLGEFLLANFEKTKALTDGQEVLQVFGVKVTATNNFLRTPEHLEQLAQASSSQRALQQPHS